MFVMCKINGYLLTYLLTSSRGGVFPTFTQSVQLGYVSFRGRSGSVAPPGIRDYCFITRKHVLECRCDCSTISVRLCVRDGKEPSFIGFGSVRVLVNFLNGGSGYVRVL